MLAVAVMLPAVLLTVRGYPADVGLKAEVSGEQQATSADPGMTLKSIVSLSSFWFIALSLGLLFSVYTAILSNLSPYVLSLNGSEEQASTLIMIVAVAGFIGKLAFGFAADKVNLKIGLWAAQLLVVLAFLLFSTQPAYWVMSVAAILLGLAAGGMLPIWGAMVATVFGLSSYGRAMGLMGPIITLLVMPSFIVVGRMFDAAGNYVNILLLFAAVTVVAALLIAPLRLRSR